MNWYYSDDQRERKGPLEDAEIAALISDGRLRADTLVWNETLENWIRADNTTLSSHFTPPPPAPPPLPQPRSTNGKPKLERHTSGGSSKVRSVVKTGIVIGGLLFAIATFNTLYNRDTSPPRESSGEYYTRIAATMCRTCAGRGRIQMTCQGCGGAGTINTPSGYVTTCPRCQGTGRGVDACPDCGGSGRRPGS